MGAEVKFGSKPKGFRLMEEGETTLKITKVKGLGRPQIKSVALEFVDAEGIVLKNNYDLTTDGGYAAFYYLVQNGMGVDLEDGSAFDIDELLNQYILVDIVHREGTKPGADGKPMIFANIKATLGPGESFDSEDSEPEDGEWED